MAIYRLKSSNRIKSSTAENRITQSKLLLPKLTSFKTCQYYFLNNKLWCMTSYHMLLHHTLRAVFTFFCVFRWENNRSVEFLKLNLTPYRTTQYVTVVTKYTQQTNSQHRPTRNYQNYGRTRLLNLQHQQVIWQADHPLILLILGRVV